MSAAVLFQNMPPLSPEEYQALESSIREHGIQVPIVVDENRTVIDGHHRQKIAQELGIECPKRVVFDKTEAEKRTLALSLNLDRRHLNREQRRALIAESIKADPELSNRQHAERTGVDHKTVSTVRGELSGRGEIPHVETHTDSLGRKQPVSKPREALPPFDPNTGDVAGEPELDGKTYTRPEPAVPRQPQRRALIDQFFDAAYDLTKAVEKVARLSEDDRFPKNAEKVAAKHRSDLTRAQDLLQEVINRLPTA